MSKQIFSWSKLDFAPYFIIITQSFQCLNVLYNFHFVIIVCPCGSRAVSARNVGCFVVWFQHYTVSVDTVFLVFFSDLTSLVQYFDGHLVCFCIVFCPCIFSTLIDFLVSPHRVGTPYFFCFVHHIRIIRKLQYSQLICEFDRETVQREVISSAIIALHTQKKRSERT